MTCTVLQATPKTTYYCNRGPKEEQTFIRQYIPLGDLPQRRSTAGCKQAGCQCHVQLSYPPGRVPDRCPVTGKLWSAGSKVYEAWQQQQQPEQQLSQPPHQPTEQHRQHVNVSTGHSSCSHVTVMFYQEHKGHQPGTADSIKFLPVHEASLMTQEGNILCKAF